MYFCGVASLKICELKALKYLALQFTAFAGGLYPAWICPGNLCTVPNNVSSDIPQCP